MHDSGATHHHAELVVIGAGIVGTSIAVSAVRRGLKVVVVDMNTTAGFGSTSASAGIVRLHAGDVASSVLARESMNVWKHWRDFAEVPADAPAAELIQCGSFIFDDGTTMLDELAHVMTDSGVEFSELDGDALASALPWADTHRFGPPASPDTEDFFRDPVGRIERAIHTPDSGYAPDPALAAQNLAHQAQKYGAHFILGVKVVSATSVSNGWVLDLSDGEKIHTESVVNAAGPGSILVNELLGVGADFRVTQRVIRQELHHVTMQEPVKNAAHIVDGDLGINFRPEGKDGFLVGSSGAEVDGEEVIQSPEKFRTDPTREGWYRQAGRASRRIPSLALTAIPSGVAGLYDATDDWLPIIDRTDRTGAYVAVGTSGNQFKTAPVIGELMLEIIIASRRNCREANSNVSLLLVPSRCGRNLCCSTSRHQP